MRVTLDGPDGWACGWISNGHSSSTPPPRQQGGGGVLEWAVIIKLLKTYCQFLEDTFFQAVVQEKVCIFQEDHDFYVGQCSMACIEILHCMASQ